MAIFSGLISTAFTAIFGGAFTSTVVGSFVIKMISSTLTSLIVQALVGKPKTQSGKQPGFSLSTSMRIGGDIPRSFIVGRTATAGSLVYANTWGTAGNTPNAYFTQVIALSDLPVTGLARVMVNGEYVTLDLGNPHASRGFPVAEFKKGGSDYLWVKFHDGNQVIADTFLVNTVSSAQRPYSANRVGFGVAYAIVTARIKRELFASFPRFRFEIDGMPLYDVTKDPSVGGSGTQDFANQATWGGLGNDSPVVQAYNIMRGISFAGQWFYGPQLMSAGRLPVASWQSMITKAAASVTTSTGSEPRYRCGGEISVDADIGDVLAEIMTSCSGRIADSGGIYKPHVGEIGATTMTMTDDVIVLEAEETFDPFHDIDETVNGIVITYPEPDEAYAMKPAPPIYNSALEADDGNRRLAIGIALPMVPYAEQTQRLGQESVAEARRQRRHTVTLPSEYGALEANDVLEWTSAVHGYPDKKFRVNAASDLPNTDIIVDLVEADPSDYSWDWVTDLQASIVVPPGSVLPVAQAISSWAVTPIAITDSTGTDRRPALALSWDGTDQDDVDALRYEVRVKSTQVLTYQSTTTDVAFGQFVVSVGILPNVEYEARAIFVANNGRDMVWTVWKAATAPDVRFSGPDLAVGAITAGSAIIGDLAVDTIQIANGAISQQSLLQLGAPQQIVGNTSDTTLLTMNITTSGADLDIILSAIIGAPNNQFHPSGTDAYAKIELLVDGQLFPQTVPHEVFHFFGLSKPLTTTATLFQRTIGLASGPHTLRARVRSYNITGGYWTVSGSQIFSREIRK